MAFDPKGVISHEIIEDVLSKRSLPFDLEAKKSIRQKWYKIDGDSLLPDLLPSSLAWLLFSEKSKRFFDQQFTGNEGISWIPLTVKTQDSEFGYFLITFAQKLSVLNDIKSTFVNGTSHIIKPHFDVKKISNYSLFTKPDSHNFWKIPTALYVSNEMKSKIEESSLIGFAFERVTCS